MQVEPYLVFNGRSEEALQFYCQALGARIEFLMRFKEAPSQEGCEGVNPEGVMHSNLRIGDSQIMASDGMSTDKAAFQGISLALAVESPEQAERFFGALAEGGQVSMPLQKTFWAKSFGMLVDRFGVSWMINCPE